MKDRSHPKLSRPQPEIRASAENASVAENKSPADGEAFSPHHLADLITGVASGRVAATDAINRLLQSAAIESGPTAPSDPSPSGVTLDLDRQQRCGFPEVIYGAGKPAELIVRIIREQQAAEQASLATRVDPQTAAMVTQRIPSARFNPVAKTISVGPAGDTPPQPLRSLSNGPADHRQGISQRAVPPHVAVITAGSTDAPVAEEAIETLHWMGIAYRSFNDIGVAGPARLLAAVPQLRQASAAIVIAGMEGALPAAVGGHLSVPVFAVPTSVGYGATLGGLTPLLGMLSSCASNVAVVNIDAGFKAAYLSALVIRPLLDRDRATNESSTATE